MPGGIWSLTASSTDAGESTCRAAVDAAAQPHLAERRDVGGRGEQPGVGTHAAEAVVGVAVVDLARVERRAPAPEVEPGPVGHPPLEGVALLGDGEVLRRAVREVAGAGQATRLEDQLGGELRERGAADAFEGDAEDDVAEVAVLEPRARRRRQAEPADRPHDVGRALGAGVHRPPAGDPGGVGEQPPQRDALGAELAPAPGATS